MKTIKRLLTLVFLLSMFSTSFAQKDLVISGGNTVSSFVCENRKVYVWGNNKTNSGTGLLGTGSMSDYESTPQLVLFPGDVDINQVNSGSGAHFLALDCSGDVWSWGNNSKGQVGNGVIGGADAFVSVPAQVQSGVLTGTHWDNGSGKLTNVSVVYAGNNNSFAILDDGRMVAWGSNAAGENQYTHAYGQLGVGDQIDHTSPMFVLDGQTGQPLEGVVQVFAGDNAAYALVDPDGDGTGTVYSWGNGLNGTLGRNVNGTDNPEGTGTVVSDRAYPVYYGDSDFGGGIMNNIKTITCGDVFGAALDDENHVWSWGNGGWNNSTGTGQGTQSKPFKVLAGTTTGASNDGTYLLASQIGGGQGYGMAVTVDLKPVAWGGGGPTDGGGFNGGSASGTEYITYAGTAVHNDVILINRGDTWGFYGRQDGSMWTWGANAVGQLGIGSTIDANAATQINPPTGCGFRDPVPYVALTPGDTTVCISSFGSLSMNSGFNISAALATNYEVRWYKNDIEQTSGSPLTNSDYTATTPGVYRVEVQYIGMNAGCSVYDVKQETLTIDTWAQTFTVPTDITFCTDSSDLYVTTPNNSIFSWFGDNSSNTPLGTSNGSNTIRLATSDGTPSGADVIFYVEETVPNIGSILTRTQFGNPTDGDDYKNKLVNQEQSFATGFSINEQVTITELSYVVKTEIQEWQSGVSTNVTPATGTVDVTFGIYGATTNNGGFVADNTNLIGTMISTFSRTRGPGDPQAVVEDVTMTGNVSLPPGMYFIGIRQVTNSSVLQNFKICRRNGTLPVGIVDDIDGTFILQDLGVSGFNNPNHSNSGLVYDIKFETAQQFCDRVPVTIKQDCPCVTPDDIVLQVSNGTTLCPTESTTISQVSNQPSTTQFDFIWYKNNVAIGTNQVTNKLDKVVNYADAGTYRVLVRDNAMPSATGCHKEATITIEASTVPTYTINGGGTFCDGDIITPVTVTISNSPTNNLITWTGPNATTDQAVTTTHTLGSVEGVYTITDIKNDFCTGVANATFGQIIINDAPNSTINASSLSYCGTTSNVTLSVVPDAGVTYVTPTYQWKKDNINFATTPTLSNVIAGVYEVTITDQGCPFTTTTVTITEHTVPTYTITGGGTFCEGETITPVVVTVSNGTVNNTISWSGPTATNNFSMTSTHTLGTDAGTYELTTLESDFCTGVIDNNIFGEIVINKKPKATINATKLTYCEGTPDITLSIVPDAGITFDSPTYQWTKNTVNNVTTATIPNATFGTYDVTITDNGCTYTTPSVTITETSLPTYTITGDGSYCPSDTKLPVVVTFTLDPSASDVTFDMALEGTTLNSTGIYNVANPLEGFYKPTNIEDNLGCKALPQTEQVQVQYFTEPTFTIDPILDVCEGTITSVNVINYVTQEPGTITWTTDRGTINNTGLLTTSGPGVYNISGSLNATAGGCVTVTPISFEIFENPIVTINSSLTKLCYDDSPELIDVSVDDHGYGMLSEEWLVDNTINNTAIVSDKFVPTHAGKMSGTYNVSYQYIDANGCTDKKSIDIEVKYTAPPTTTSHNSMISENLTPVVSASDLETLATVTWYDTDQSTVMSNANPYTIVTIPGNVVINKEIYATQTSEGCESEKKVTSIVITDCPIPAPNVNLIAPVCVYDNIPEIQASVGSTWGNGTRPFPTIAPEFRFYVVSINGTPIANETDGTYTPVNPYIDMSVAGDYDFWVSEYNENVVVGACEGPRTKVTIKVNKTLPITILPVDNICENETNPTFSVSGRVGDVEWHLSPPTYPANSGSVYIGNTYTPTKLEISSVGTTQVWAVHRAGGCVSTDASQYMTINSIPVKPLVTPNEICEGETTKSVCATPLSGGIIKWYSAPIATPGTLLNTIDCYNPLVVDDGIYTYYATQTINDCESETNNVLYTIKPLPTKPIISATNTVLCEGDANPKLGASGDATAIFVWYDSDGVSELQRGPNTDSVIYVLPNGTSTKTYFTSQIVDGCEGPTDEETISVVGKPTNPIVTDNTVCDGMDFTQSTAALTSDSNTDKWYHTSDLTDVPSIGYTYVPTVSEVASNDFTMYVVRESTLPGCLSDIIPVTLNVVTKPTFKITPNEADKCIHLVGETVDAYDFSEGSLSSEDKVSWTVDKGNRVFEYEGAILDPNQYFDNNATQDEVYRVTSTYSYKVPNVVGLYCVSDVLEMNYTVHIRPEIPIIQSSIICAGETVQPIVAIGSDNMSWFSKDAKPSTISNSTTYTFANPSELEPKVYRFDVVDFNEFGCDSEIGSGDLTVAKGAEPKIIGDTIICQGEIESGYSTKLVDGNSYSWTFTGNNTIYTKDDNYKNVMFVDWENIGYDTVRVTETTEFGCTNIDSIAVKIIPNPIAEFDWSLPGAGSTVKYINLSTQESIIDGDVSEEITFISEWNYGKIMNRLDSVDNTVEYNDRKTPLYIDYKYGYWNPLLKVTNNYGCYSTYTEEIFTPIETALFVPDAVSPSNPAHGVRYWQPKGFNIDKMFVTVFDQWGNIVWYSDEVVDGNFVGKWDCMYNGKMLKSDSYIWKIEAVFLDGQAWKGVKSDKGKYSIYGSVLIIR